jgi:hypothetical protein
MAHCQVLGIGHFISSATITEDYFPHILNGRGANGS